MFDAGIRMVGTDRYAPMVIVADASEMSSSHANLDTAQELLVMMRKGYPGRLGEVVIFPAPLVARAAFKVIRPLFPAAVRQKVRMMSRESGLQALSELGLDQYIPPNCGGSCSHDDDACDLDAQARNQRSRIDQWMT
jgi:hypothetical protein